MIIENIEMLKKVISSNRFSQINGNANISRNQIADSMLNETRTIGFLLDFENYLTFKVVDHISHTSWCNKEIVSFVYYYHTDYKNFLPNISLINLFKIMSSKMCNELKNDTKYMIKLMIHLSTTSEMEKFIEIVNPILLNDEVFKESYLKILNRKMIYSMAEKIN